MKIKDLQKLVTDHVYERMGMRIDPASVDVSKETMQSIFGEKSRRPLMERIKIAVTNINHANAATVSFLPITVNDVEVPKVMFCSYHGKRTPVEDSNGNYVCEICVGVRNA